MNKTIRINSVADYERICGLSGSNALAFVGNLHDMRHPEIISGKAVWHYGVYAVFLKLGVCGDIRYGHTKYDYSEGTVTSFEPGQVVTVDNGENLPAPECPVLLFHPDLVHGTPLGRRMSEYHYFAYNSHEALHLSSEEKGQYLELLQSVEEELKAPASKDPRTVICSKIELLLNHLQTAYDRQFQSRKEENQGIVHRFENSLNEYYGDSSLGLDKSDGLPSVKYFADKCFLSPNYFGDLIKRETGKSPMEIIRQKVVTVAKEQLRGTNSAISDIAFRLGFGYTQHFCRYFKEITGMTPTQYRLKV